MTTTTKNKNKKTASPNLRMCRFTSPAQKPNKNGTFVNATVRCKQKKDIRNEINKTKNLKKKYRKILY